TKRSRLLEAVCAPVPSVGAVAGAGFGAALTLATTGFAIGLGAATLAGAFAAALVFAGAAFAAGLLTAAFGVACLAAAVAAFLGAAALTGVAALAGLAEVLAALAGAAAGLLVVLWPKASDAASNIAMVLIARVMMLSVSPLTSWQPLPPAAMFLNRD